MSNVLQVFWRQMFGQDDDDERPHVRWRARLGSGDQASATIFVIMRRRRMSHLSTCYYMGILAIADTSVLLLGLSVMWIYFVNRKWSLLLQSRFACKFLSVLFYTVSDISVWLVCMINVPKTLKTTRVRHRSY